MSRCLPTAYRNSQLWTAADAKLCNIFSRDFNSQPGTFVMKQWSRDVIIYHVSMISGSKGHKLLCRLVRFTMAYKGHAANKKESAQTKKENTQTKKKTRKQKRNHAGFRQSEDLEMPRQDLTTES